MNKTVHYIGLDVHKETIAVAIALQQHWKLVNYELALSRWDK
jgi:hypothetical protein